MAPIGAARGLAAGQSLTVRSPCAAEARGKQSRIVFIGATPLRSGRRCAAGTDLGSGYLARAVVRRMDVDRATCGCAGINHPTWPGCSTRQAQPRSGFRPTSESRNWASGSTYAASTPHWILACGLRRCDEAEGCREVVRDYETRSLCAVGLLGISAPTGSGTRRPGARCRPSPGQDRQPLAGDNHDPSRSARTSAAARSTATSPGIRSSRSGPTSIVITPLPH